jgi:hypothetical protein
MEYLENSNKPNSAHLFRIKMITEVREDICFDFKIERNMIRAEGHLKHQHIWRYSAQSLPDAVNN